MRMLNLIAVMSITASCVSAFGQGKVTVRPKEIDDVLTNPGMGFMTFQRFNGDTLNSDTEILPTEGLPIVYEQFDGDLKNKDHPMTTIAYFRVYWKFIEPEKGKYRWDMIDKALKTAHQRKQSLMLRIAPYGYGTVEEMEKPYKKTGDLPEWHRADVPAWYRQMVGEKKKLLVHKWRVDPEDPRYVKYFGDLIRKLGWRYDGHPDLESVDVAIVGPWGEGAGAELLTQKTRQALVDAYLESFKKTSLIILLTDKKTVSYALSRADVGWRFDCLGDMRPNWSHMNDVYPQRIINFGARDAWKKAPVSFEVCWVIQHWKNMGWDIDYIIDQSLKWHISSFNAKSSPVPDEWWPNVNRWLKKMGYRFVLRKFTYPSVLKPNGKLSFTSWWENKGVAPCYKRFPLALRLKNDKKTQILITDADIRTWLPGDNLYDDAVFVPLDMPPGEYDLQIGILDRLSNKPKVKLAISARQQDGWYSLGKINVRH